jgi:hypothetical protein
VRFYSTLLNRRHKVPVHSTVVLLRPAADGPDLNGCEEKRYRNGRVYDRFWYDIVRVWEQPVEEILNAGLAVLPLARLTILRLGRQQFGEPDDGARSIIDAIDDVDQLNSLLDRILTVSCWNDLLTIPVSPA